MVGNRVVRLFGWTENALDRGVVIKEREEHRDALDNGRPEPGFDPEPIVVEPAFDGFKLLLPFVVLLWLSKSASFGLNFVLDALALQDRSQVFREGHAHA